MWITNLQPDILYFNLVSKFKQQFVDKIFVFMNFLYTHILYFNFTWIIYMEIERLLNNYF